MTNNFFEKESYTEADILQLIESGAEEGLNLEFKQAEAIEDTKEIAKDVAAMANAGGGIIIYGIEEQEHRAFAISFIDGQEYSKERLDQIISGNISRRIPDVKIYPIRIGGDLQQTIYLVKIPESPLAPHMTHGKYYRRYNFTTMTMAEYEVRNAYMKIQTPVLQLEEPRIKLIKRLEEGGLYKLSTHISNIGTRIERFFKFELIVPKNLYTPKGEQDISPLETFKTHEGSNFVRIVIPNTEPIFQNETLKMPNGYLKLPNENTYMSWKGIDYTITLKLYFTGGILVEDFSLFDIWVGSRLMT
jgi:hypothetical protein